jgi:hypothetical protein
MSLAALRRSSDAEPAGAQESLLRSTFSLATLALILSLAKFWPTIVAVWTTGAFDNTDDAMRLVEIRDWLAGQAWFDLHQYRLDPPGGLLMHWTRVLDAPLAALIKIFSIFCTTEQAERLARLVFPSVLLFGFYAAAIDIARRYIGPSAALPAAAIAIMTGSVFGQFEAGRIHHHGPQILLAVLILRATLDAVSTVSRRQAALAAALSALSLAINIENIAYILVEIGVFSLVFVARGEPFRATLASFAASLVVASVAMFAATIGPQLYVVGACDAFSTAHLTAIVLGAASLLLTCASARRLPAWPQRLGACALGGALVIAAIAVFYPACLHDPQAGVDPLLRQYWLNHVEEARPLLSLIVSKPRDFFFFALAPLFGLAATVVAIWRTRGEARLYWTIIGAFAAIGLVTSLWEIRAIASASACALFGGVWASTLAIDRANRSANLFVKLATLPILLSFCSTFWGALTILVEKPAEKEPDSIACRSPAAIRVLNTLPKSLLLAPIDLGSDILADTDHSVLAAPYHRNNHGNGILVRAMVAPPDDARKIVAGSGATYFVYCPDMPELYSYASGNPDSLAAHLLRDDVPSWLGPVASPADSTLRIFTLR